jgi:hypothetical protein
MSSYIRLSSKLSLKTINNAFNTKVSLSNKRLISTIINSPQLINSNSNGYIYSNNYNNNSSALLNNRINNNNINKYYYKRCMSSDVTIEDNTIEPEYVQHILMPDIMDATHGTIDQWLKSEGDHVTMGERISIVVLNDGK